MIASAALNDLAAWQSVTKLITPLPKSKSPQTQALIRLTSYQTQLGHSQVNWPGVQLDGGSISV
jgi:hypothetical protein